MGRRGGGGTAGARRHRGLLPFPAFPALWGVDTDAVLTEVPAAEVARHGHAGASLLGNQLWESSEAEGKPAGRGGFCPLAGTSCHKCEVASLQ